MNRSTTLRVVDANLNRASEGLRTIEDIARLVCEDAVAARWVKELRHQLAATLQPIGRAERLASRCAASDAGTQIDAEAEQSRDSWQSVVAAAAERVAQSLRSLEEATKLELPEMSGRIKQLRYSAYDLLAKAELRLFRDRRQLDTAHVCVLIDCQLPLEQFSTYVRCLAQSGAGMVQLRDKAADGGVLVRYGRAAREALVETNCSLVINDRADVAVACRAHGVHVGQTDLSIDDVRQIVGPDMWIGVSTHSLEQAIAAENAGADYIGCGPVFPSRTKAFDAFAGLELLKEVRKTATIPWFAIGGINLQNLQEVVDTGCCHVAVSHAVHAATDPAAVVRQMHEMLKPTPASRT